MVFVACIVSLAGTLLQTFAYMRGVDTEADIVAEDQDSDAAVTKRALASGHMWPRVQSAVSAVIGLYGQQGALKQFLKPLLERAVMLPLEDANGRTEVPSDLRELSDVVGMIARVCVSACGQVGVRALVELVLEVAARADREPVAREAMAVAVAALRDPGLSGVAAAAANRRVGAVRGAHRPLDTWRAARALLEDVVAARGGGAESTDANDTMTSVDNFFADAHGAIAPFLAVA